MLMKIYMQEEYRRNQVHFIDGPWTLNLTILLGKIIYARTKVMRAIQMQVIEIQRVLSNRICGCQSLITVYTV